MKNESLKKFLFHYYERVAEKRNSVIAVVFYTVGHFTDPKKAYVHTQKNVYFSKIQIRSKSYNYDLARITNEKGLMMRYDTKIPQKE